MVNSTVPRKRQASEMMVFSNVPECSIRKEHQNQEPYVPVPTTPDQYPDGSAFGDVVQVVVGRGEAQETHIVHKGLLEFYSTCFRDMFKDGFARTEDEKVVYKDVDPETFSDLKTWLYTREVGMNQDRLVDLLVLGTRLKIPLLENEVINSLSMDCATATIHITRTGCTLEPIPKLLKAQVSAVSTSTYSPGI